MSSALILLRDWQASQIEFWRPLVEGFYDVSNFGRIRSLRVAVNQPEGGFKSVLRKKPLVRKTKAQKGSTSGGYVRFHLNKQHNKRARALLVHRIVAQAFIPNPAGLPEVNHLNCIKTDNRSDNLKWVTRSENIIHSVVHGLRNNFMLVRKTDYEYFKARVAYLEEQLAEERAANRESERHWANMLLRAKQTYPLQPKPTLPQPVDAPPLEPAGGVPGMDPGELEALVETGAQYGVSRADVIRTLKQERGL